MKMRGRKQSIAIILAEKRKGRARASMPMADVHQKAIVAHALGLAHHMHKLRGIGAFGKMPKALY